MIEIYPLHILYHSYSTEENSVEFYIEINDYPDDPDRSEWKRVYHSRAYKRPGESYIHFPVGDIVSSIYDKTGDMDVFAALNSAQYCYIPKVALVLADETILQEWYANPLDWTDSVGHYDEGDTYTINSNVVQPSDHLKIISYLEMSEKGPRIRTTRSYTPTLCGTKNLLFYRNQRGGIDVFNFEGTVKKTKKLTNHDYKVDFRRPSLSETLTHNLATKRYAVEHTNTYSLTSGWLSDKQAENLVDELFGSPDIVYVKQNESGYQTPVPVIITDTSVEYKTYQNQGKKLVNYTINIEETPTYLRK